MEPPVEWKMVAVTSLGPERVTASSHSPFKECEKTDRVVTRTYNVATQATHSASALAILLVDLRKTDNLDYNNTTAHVTHSQLIREVGGVVLSAMMWKRYVCLVHTYLLENIKSCHLYQRKFFTLILVLDKAVSPGT